MTISTDNDLQIAASDSHDMPLTAVVSRFCQQQEWGEKISINYAARRSTLAIELDTNGQLYKVYVEVDEGDQMVSVYIYTPFGVSDDRMGEMARLLNFINNNINFGRLGFLDDGDRHPVRFDVSFDFTGSACSLQQVSIMVDAGMWTMDRYGKAIAAVALADVSAKDSWGAHQGRELIEDPQGKIQKPTLH